MDVVVPTYNHAEMVSNAARVLTGSAVASVVIVDDVSSDDTLERLQDAPAPVHVLALDEHRGLAHAMNAGWQSGTARWVLFLNDDVLPVGNAITELVQAAELFPAAIYAGGLLTDPDGGPAQVSYLPRTIPGTAALVARLTGLERYWRTNPLTGGHLTQPLPLDRPSVTDRQPAGACLLVRRDVLEAIGGWDEGFWFWYEDVDLVRRLLAHGAGVFVPSAKFEHLGRHSTRAWQRAAQHSRLLPSSLYYASKHLGFAGRLVVGLAVASTSILRAISSRVRGDAASAATYAAIARRGLHTAGGGPAPDLGQPVGMAPRTRPSTPTCAG